MNYSKDSQETYRDKNLIRRRFYLSKESLKCLDTLAIRQNKSPSILLDAILKQISENYNNS